jgi:hypothetical protein
MKFHSFPAKIICATFVLGTFTSCKTTQPQNHHKPYQAISETGASCILHSTGAAASAVGMVFFVTATAGCGVGATAITVGTGGVGAPSFTACALPIGGAMASAASMSFNLINAKLHCIDNGGAQRMFSNLTINLRVQPREVIGIRAKEVVPVPIGLGTPTPVAAPAAPISAPFDSSTLSFVTLPGEYGDLYETNNAHLAAAVTARSTTAEQDHDSVKNKFCRVIYTHKLVTAPGICFANVVEHKNTYIAHGDGMAISQQFPCGVLIASVAANAQFKNPTLENQLCGGLQMIAKGTSNIKCGSDVNLANAACTSLGGIINPALSCQSVQQDFATFLHPRFALERGVTQIETCSIRFFN